MSRWTGIVIVGIWVGMAIMTFNVGFIPVMKEVVQYGAGTSLIIAVIDLF
jgi:hypothetical protein